MADYMAGKKPQGRIQEASQSVGSIATINKEPLIGLSTIGDAVSLPCALSLLPSPLSALSPAPARRRRA